MNDLENFFTPRKIALIGARSSFGFGYTIPLNMQRNGWGDKLHLMNPKGGELHGLPVYSKIADIPDPCDLAVVVIPAPGVPQVMEDLGQRGIKHVIIESAGFAEVGEEGKDIQDRTQEAARRHGVRVLGPNCVGVTNTRAMLTTAETMAEAMVPGNIAIIAQSGVFGNVLLDKFYQHQLYISKSITMGNRIDVDEAELLEYLAEDDDTTVILMYLEGAADGRRLKEALDKVARKKPVLMLKSGATESGKAATASHTGSMSGQDELYEAALAQTGALRMGSLQEMMDTALAFSCCPLPRGNRVGIATTTGSLGVLATDMAVKNGLAVGELGAECAAEIAAMAPDFMNVRNPIDTGTAPIYGECVRAMMKDPDIDMVLCVVIMPFNLWKEVYHKMGIKYFGDLAAIREEFPEKPLMVAAIGNSKFVEDMDEIGGPRVPVYSTSEPAAKALANMWRFVSNGRA